MNGTLGIILHRSFWAVMILGYFFISGTTCTAQSLPFLPDELTQILESGLPKTLPSPVETGHFKKLPAGDGFVWLAESTATLKKGHKLAFSKTFDTPLKEDEVGFVAVRCRIVDVDNNANEPRPDESLFTSVTERHFGKQLCTTKAQLVVSGDGTFTHFEQPNRLPQAQEKFASVLTFNRNVLKSRMSVFM